MRPLYLVHNKGPGSSNLCLLEDTPVSNRPIRDLEVGDTVLCLDGGRVDATFVTHVLKDHRREGYTVLNNDLRITNDHPVLVIDDGPTWIRTEDLRLGDALVTANGTIPVTSIEYADEPAMTVYLETAAGNFLAGGGLYVVHGYYARTARRDAYARATTAPSHEVGNVYLVHNKEDPQGPGAD